MEELKTNRIKNLSPNHSKQRGNNTILSTKVLSPSQKSLVLNAGLHFVEYNAINIRPLEVQLPQEQFDALIFTSQNAVKSYFDHNTTKKQKTNIAFCVGEKTKALLEQFNVKVEYMANNAEALGNFIVGNDDKKSYLFISGQQRLNTLPEMLIKNNVRYKEVQVYKNERITKKWNSEFNGILFFSPSAVISYTELNSLKNSVAYCIGNTTEAEAKKHTDKTVVANKPTIENVIVQAVKMLGQK